MIRPLWKQLQCSQSFLLQRLRPVHHRRSFLGGPNTRGLMRGAVMSTPKPDSAQVLYSEKNGIGTIVLNRPEALNSLNTNMVSIMRDVLKQRSSSVACMVIKGAGGKAFCAGGDVKAASIAAQTGQPPGEPMAFFRTEYALDLEISQLAVPYVALADGIVMGGGAGLSMNGAFRVVTERSVFAMPECAIGLFPDVGAAHFLQRQVPGPLGLYLVLTGTRLKGAEIKECGLATHFIRSTRLGELEDRLHALGPAARDFNVVDTLLCELEGAGDGGASLAVVEGAPVPLVTGGPPPAGAISAGRHVMDGHGTAAVHGSTRLQQYMPHTARHFGRGSVVEIVASLEAARGDPGVSGSFACESLEAMRKGSPISMLVAFEQLRRTRHMSLAEVLSLDQHLVQEFANGRGDWYEGVRAMLIDKGDKPRWKYSSLHEVPPGVIDAIFPGHFPSAVGKGERGAMARL